MVVVVDVGWCGGVVRFPIGRWMNGWRVDRVMHQIPVRNKAQLFVLLSLPLLLLLHI